MNQLRHMAVFAHIVDSGSITAAAEALQLSKSVVSQQLKALEKSLGVSLLKRTTRRQTLTVAGQDFYHHCKSLNYIANKAWQQAQQGLEVPQGAVRITAPNALMETLVAPAIAVLMKQYPQLQPELISHDHQLDLMAENIDLAIRVGQSNNSTLKQRRLGEFRDVLCASELFLKHNPVADNLLKGAQAETFYIANTWQGKTIEHRLQPLNTQIEEEVVFSVTAHCSANSFHTCLTLIETGAGIGLVPDFRFLSSEPILQAVFPKHQLAINPVYALHTFDAQLPLSVNVCLMAIEQQLALISADEPM